MRIGRNPASETVLRNLTQASDQVGSVSTRLSSGLRINKAADDAAGLAVSSGLNTSQRVYGQAMRNISDGVSYLNIADGALAELSNIVTRQLELAAQSANGVYSVTQRRALNAEANALVDEYNRIVGSAEFNGLPVIDAARAGDAVKIQAGVHGENADLLSLELGARLSTNAGDGTFSLVCATTSHSGATPVTSKFVTLADVNGDGAQDMIVAGQTAGQGTTSILLNNGSGGFNLKSSLSTSPASVAGYTTAAHAADLNGDGFLDLVSIGYEDNGSGNRSVARVFTGDGAGNFSLKGALNAYDSGLVSVGYAAALEDLDGNGTVDLMTAGVDNNYAAAQFWLNDGNGTFTRSSSVIAPAVGSGFMTAGLADLNNDGRLDVVAGGYGWQGASTSNVWTVMNNGSGNFSVASEQIMVVGGNSGCRGIATGDFNGDGYTDAAIAGIDASSGTTGVTYLMTNTGGSLTRTATLSTNTGPTAGYSYSANLADLNGDGYLDLVAAGRSVNGGAEHGYATSWLNDGRGSFSLTQTFTSNMVGPSSFTNHTAVGDVTGDGALDVVAVGPVDRTGTTYGEIAIYGANAHATTAVPHLNIASQSGARQAIASLKAQLQRISAERGELGAALRRMDTALNVTAASRQEFAAAESRIIDADMAQEAGDYMRLQIRQNAASAMAAHVNRESGIVLRLLDF